MFDYVKAMPVYCNGIQWLSLPDESRITTPYVAGNKKFVSSGSTVQFVVPNGVPSHQYPLTIKIWGAGGGTGAESTRGGGGGFSRISMTSGVTAGKEITQRKRKHFSFLCRRHAACHRWRQRIQRRGALRWRRRRRFVRQTKL